MKNTILTEYAFSLWEYGFEDIWLYIEQILY